jgi:hypothetical protein
VILDEQNLTVCEDIHVVDMDNVDREYDLVNADLISVITVKDINGDQDMTGKLNYLFKNYYLIQEQEDLINKITFITIMN